MFVYIQFKEHYLQLQERDSVPHCWFQPVCLSAVKLLQSLLEECSHMRNIHPQTEIEIEESGDITLLFLLTYSEIIKFYLKYLLHGMEMTERERERK